MTTVVEPRLQNAVENLKVCIDRFAESEFHNGKNKNGRKYLNWETLFRDEETLSGWLDDNNFVGTEARR